jgi:hypothetical protein
LSVTKADATKRLQMAQGIEEMAAEFFKEVHIPAEKDILTAQLKLYATKSTGYDIAPAVKKIASTSLRMERQNSLI